MSLGECWRAALQQAKVGGRLSGAVMLLVIEGGQSFDWKKKRSEVGGRIGNKTKKIL